MDDQNIKPENVLVVPCGVVGQPSLQFDMKNVRYAESRVHDIATVNKHKAPELLSVFNEAARDLWKYQYEVEKCLITAKKVQAKVHSTIILDKVPSILREKGLSTSKSPAGSEDLRNAILSADPEYEAATDQVETLKAIGELIKNMLKSMEWSFTSVKKVLGESGYGSTPSRSHGAESSGFGRPHY